MAEGDLNKTITADGSQALREYVKLQNENQKLKESIRRVTQESKEGGSQFDSIIKSNISSVVSMATGLLSIGSVLGGLRQGYAEWNAEMEAANDTAEKLASTTIKALTQTGLLLKGQQAEKILGSLGGVTPEQGLAALTGVAEGGPGLTLERQGDLARQVARFAPLEGGDAGAMKDVGTLMGRLADIFPAKTADDLADVAASMRASAGKDLGQLTDAGTLRGLRGLASSGAMSDSEAMGFGMLAANKEIGAKTVAGLAAKLTEEMDVIAPQRGKALTADQLAHNRFASADASGRLDLLLSDKAVREKILGGQAAMQLGQISRTDIAAAGQRIDQAQSGDLLRQMLDAAANTKTGSIAIGEQQEAILRNQGKARLANKAMERDAVSVAYDVAMDNTEQGILGRLASGTQYGIGQLLGAASSYTPLGKTAEFLGGPSDAEAGFGGAVVGAAMRGDAGLAKALIDNLAAIKESSAETVQQLENANRGGASVAAANARNNHRE